MSYSPFVLMWGEEKRNVLVLILSFRLAFLCDLDGRKKGKDGEELERSLTAFFHSRGMERGDDYEG